MSEVIVAPAQYKESGVQWLGKIPAHWEVKRIKDLSELQSGETITSQQLTDEGYPVYGGNGKRGFFSRYNLQGEYILIGRQGALCGNINYATGKFWASEHAVVVYKDKAVNTIWYGELLRIMNLNQYSLAAAQPGLSVDKIKRLELPFAPPAEQQAIAAYITRHTAAIDRKIDLLGQKIKLYQTLRKTLINETVCRGLHPHAPRKDSGTAWIGEIPAHWQVKRLKDVAILNAKALPENTPADYTFRYVDISNVGKSGLQEDTELVEFQAAPSRARRIVRKHDVIVSTVRTYLKAVAYFDYDPVDVIVSTGFAVLTPSKAVAPGYLAYQVRSDFFVDNVVRFSEGVSYPAINASIIAALHFVYPPHEEQVAIAAHLDAKTQQLDTITTNLTTQIATLKELRKTLINDVVTGKLNVMA